MCTDKTPRRSLADPYHFNTDPGSEKCRYGSRSKQNFDTDPEPGKKRFSNRKLLKIGLKKPSYPMFFVFILLNYPFSINNHLNQVKKYKLIFCFRSREIIRIRIRSTAAQCCSLLDFRKIYFAYYAQCQSILLWIFEKSTYGPEIPWRWRCFTPRSVSQFWISANLIV